MSGPHEAPPRDPLDHTALRIIELGSGLAARVCGKLFAALGETVWKSDLPDDAGHGRGVDALDQDKRRILWNNAGLASDISALDTADVAIVDQTSLECGIDISALRQRFPRLVVVSFTTLGLTEPTALPEDSLLAESFGGLATMIGEPDCKPLQLGGEQACFAGAFVGFLGAVLALQRRNAGHGGDTVDVSLADVMAYVDWKSDILADWSGVAPSRTGTSGGAWRIIDAADGKVGVIFQPDQWDALVRLVGDPRLADPALADTRFRQDAAEHWWPWIREWAATRSKVDIYHQAQALGLPFGFGADVADLVNSEQYRERGFIRPGVSPPIGALFQSDRLIWNDSAAVRPVDSGQPAVIDMANGGSEAPLAGLRVLDLGTITAGAATGRLLADYGASVIKVESSSRPDPFRQWPAGGPLDAGESPMFESNNAGKLGIDLDLTNPYDRNRFYDLVREAHVVIENFRVGVTEKLGVDQATLRRLNANLIYLSLSSQGQSGPEARYRSYGSTLDLLSGLASVTGYAGGDPIWSSVDVNYPDQLVSLFGAGLVAYCVLRGRRGLMLDVSQREAVSWTLSSLVDEYMEAGIVAAPRGNERPGRFPHDVYPCRGRDRWVAISCSTDAERSSLCRLLGLPEQTEHDPSRFAELADEAIAAWTLVRERDEAVCELTAAGLACVPVNTAKDRASSAHFLKRRVFLPGPPRRKGFPFVMQGYEPPVPTPAPAVGEHNRLLDTEGPWPELSASNAIGARIQSWEELRYD